jgi:hypothetical protein
MMNDEIAAAEKAGDHARALLLGQRLKGYLRYNRLYEK